MRLTSRTVFLCISIVLNAISAGGIFCFPLFASSLASSLNLNQGQLSAIAIAGMMGQYPFASLWGILVDRKGPWMCSLSASGLLGFGYFLFAFTIRSASSSHTCSTPIFLSLVFYFFLCGLGTVSSYFSSLFGASKTFPGNRGLATGLVTALFGLSPLVLSTIGNVFFTDEENGLDAPKYLYFLACFCGLINLFGAFGLRAVPQTPRPPVLHSPNEATGDHQTHEETPLLHSQEDYPIHHHESLLSLLLETDFWLLAVLMLICMGMAEMVISNIGTIVASFKSSEETLQLDPGPQIRLISLANTFSRLFTGLVADLASPSPTKEQSTGKLIFSPTRIVSRTVFVWLSCSMLLLSFGWMGFGVIRPQGLWAVSLGAGAAYGMMWTVVPSLVECVWGSKNAGRNFGTISYAPFLGTPIFTFLYAFFSDRAREPGPDPLCRGVGCWKPTFEICTGILCGATVIATVLWRRWAHRV